MCLLYAATCAEPSRNPYHTLGSGCCYQLLLTDLETEAQIGKAIHSRSHSQQGTGPLHNWALYHWGSKSPSPGAEQL